MNGIGPRLAAIVAAVLIGIGICAATLTPDVASAATAPANPLTLVSSQQLDARLWQLTFTTPAIVGQVHVRILLPAGYATTTQHYPVLYLLHGSTGNAATWTTEGLDAEPDTANLPLIVVMPDGGSNGEYTNWVNGGAGGPPEWETFHIDELIPWIDAHYRTIAKRQDRLIAGVSMGGLGTMEYAARYPDLFGAAASMSGAVSTASPVGLAAIEVGEHLYGNEPVGAIYGSPTSDQLNYRAHSPTDLAINLADTQLWMSAYNGIPGSSCQVTGDADVLLEEATHEMSLELDAALSKVGIAHTWRDLGDGTHSIGCFNNQLALVLPWLMSALAHPTPTPTAVTYTTDAPSYSQWGWNVAVTRKADEFSTLLNASTRGFALEGSGTAVVATPATYTPRARYRVTIDPSTSGEPGASGPEVGCIPTAALSAVTTVDCAANAATPPDATSVPFTQSATRTTLIVTAAKARTLTIPLPLGASNTTQEFTDGSDSSTEIYKTVVTVTKLVVKKKRARGGGAGSRGRHPSTAGR